LEGGGGQRDGGRRWKEGKRGDGEKNLKKWRNGGRRWKEVKRRRGERGGGRRWKEVEGRADLTVDPLSKDLFDGSELFARFCVIVDGIE